MSNGGQLTRREVMFMFVEERMLHSHIIMQGTIREWSDDAIINKMVHALLRYHPECAKNTNNRDVAEELFTVLRKHLSSMEDDLVPTTADTLDGMIARGETFDALSW